MFKQNHWYNTNVYEINCNNWVEEERTLQVNLFVYFVLYSYYSVLLSAAVTQLCVS